MRGGAPCDQRKTKEDCLVPLTKDSAPHCKWAPGRVDPNKMKCQVSDIDAASTGAATGTVPGHAEGAGGGRRRRRSAGRVSRRRRSAGRGARRVSRRRRSAGRGARRVSRRRRAGRR